MKRSQAIAQARAAVDQTIQQDIVCVEQVKNVSVEEDSHPDEPGQLLDQSKKDFKYCCKAFLITYKTHIHKGEYEYWCKNKLSSWFIRTQACKKVKFIHFRMAHETGTHKGEDPSKPYPHTHVVIVMGDTFYARGSRWFDYEGIHPHVQSLTHKTRVINALHYIGKEDPENADLLEGYSYAAQHRKRAQEDGNPDQPIFVSIAKDAPDARTFALKACKTISEYDKAQNVYNLIHERHIPCAVTLDHFVGWQSDFHNWMNANSSVPIVPKPPIKDTRERGDNSDLPGWDDLVDKTSRWLGVGYNAQGNCGKSAFQQAMELAYPKRVLSFQCVPSYRDFATIVVDALTKGWSGDTIMFNLPRSHADADIYTTLEAAIDGKVTSTKFRGETLYFPIRNVWIFTNTMLDVRETGTVTKDRWKIYQIGASPNGTPTWPTYIPYYDALHMWEAEHDVRKTTELRKVVQSFGQRRQYPPASSLTQ